ncbi:hypothetical protein AB205_0050010, partial [Aquarana catesbeiana]
MLQPSHRKGRREATLAQAPTGEATRPSSPQKQKHPKCSMVVSTSQEQTLTSDHLQDWSTNRKVSVVSSPRMFLWSQGISLLDPAQTLSLWTPNPLHSEGQSEPEEEESIRESLVC